MIVNCENNNVVLESVQDFNIVHIFDCGQCFRFNRVCDNRYIGVAFGKILDIEQNGDCVTLRNTTLTDYENIWCDFLDLNRNYGEIKSTLTYNDTVMSEAIKCGEGIRILRQDAWETIVSFIISQTNNIPRIKGIIERLCENFGDPILYENKVYYSFPSAETINALSLEDLSVIRAGFRDKYIKAAAAAVSDGELCIDELRLMSASDAKKKLISIKGIGNKVSDCIILFGLNHTGSFPVDVWIKRIMEYCYFKSEQSISTISAFANNKFGDLGGFAQQYLFFYARENKIGV